MITSTCVTEKYGCGKLLFRKKYLKRKIKNGTRYLIKLKQDGKKYLKKYKPNNILIHDAARPDFTIKLLRELLGHLKRNIAVIPYINSKDTIKYKVKNELYNLNRKNTYLTQTPQAFKFKKLYELAINEKNKITDEATLFIKNNLKH